MLESGITRQNTFFRFWLLLLYSLFFSVVHDTAFAFESSWKADPWDERKMLPNDARPPDRREPSMLLPPLEEHMVGTIRRVSIGNEEKIVALTFDMCELATVTTGCDMDVLNFLREEKIPATLFMGGKWMRTHARRVLQIMNEPLFEIGNHAWTHGNCALLSSSGLRAQVLWTQAQYELLREEVLRQAEMRGMPVPNIAPVPTLFRLPYGRCTPAALKTLSSLGMRVILWDVVAEVGDNSKPMQAKKSARWVVDQVRQGSILLFHANRVPRGTAQLLREVVTLLQAQGYRFTTVSTLLRMGTPVMRMDGYFRYPGDNKQLDGCFGVDGTGLRTPFMGD